MAQAKKKQATKTAKKTTAKCGSAQKKKICCKKYERGQQSNIVFVISMSILAATLLFADLILINA